MPGTACDHERRRKYGRREATFLYTGTRQRTMEEPLLRIVKSWRRRVVWIACNLAKSQRRSEEELRSVLWPRCRPPTKLSSEPRVHTSLRSCGGKRRRGKLGREKGGSEKKGRTGKILANPTSNREIGNGSIVSIVHTVCVGTEELHWSKGLV